MKNIFAFLLLLVSSGLFAQFPAPKNFSFQGKYILLGECDDCLIMHLLCGPTYCTLFTWQEPSETTTATLDHYNVYGKLENQIIFSATATTNSHWAQMPPLGEFWVTAVYTNPDGESLPSNVETGWSSLPTALLQPLKVEDNVNYSKEKQTLIINSIKNVLKINLIDTNGRIAKSFCNPTQNIDVSELPKGFYIIQIYFENANALKQKFIKL